jgi:NAD(P)-dependent dehydrogenase (short-subunit alcohol dehydrogenase family)
LAGIYGVDKPSHELSAEDFDNIMGTNFRGLWLCARAELRIMMRQERSSLQEGRPGFRGSVVNVGSNLALVSKGGTRKSEKAMVRERSPGYNKELRERALLQLPTTHPRLRLSA